MKLGVWMEWNPAQVQKSSSTRVKREFFIEDHLKKRADDYGESLPYTYDPSLKKDDGGFRFVFDGRVLRCSSEHPSFIYVDAGCWVDNADGKGKKCRDFALVSGPHVYLCEFNHSKSAPRSRVDSVHKFFDSKTGNLFITVPGAVLKVNFEVSTTLKKST